MIELDGFAESVGYPDDSLLRPRSLPGRPPYPSPPARGDRECRRSSIRRAISGIGRNARCCTNASSSAIRHSVSCAPRPAGGRFPARALRALRCRKVGGIQLQEARVLSCMWRTAHGRDRSAAGRCGVARTSVEAMGAFAPARAAVPAGDRFARADAGARRGAADDTVCIGPRAPIRRCSVLCPSPVRRICRGSSSGPPRGSAGSRRSAALLERDIENA